MKDNIIDYKKKIAEDFRIKHKNKPENILFTLQQNEMVYLPMNKEDEVISKSNTEFIDWISNPNNKKAFCKRIYKVVKFTGKDCFFIPHNFANPISVAKNLSKEELDKLKEKYGEKKVPNQERNYEEFGSYRDCSPYEAGETFVNNLVNKKQKQKPLKIQDSCIKIQIDWLGNITIANS